MSPYDWQQIREQAARTIGYPDAATEQPILDVFEHSPAAVSQAVAKIVSRVQADKLQAHAGWLIVRREAQEISRPAPNVVADDQREKQRRLERAKTWIYNAGVYCDRLSDVEDELFGGSTRTLSVYASDPAVREEVARYWQEQRPRGERGEAEAETEMARYRRPETPAKAGLDPEIETIAPEAAMPEAERTAMETTRVAA